MNTEMYACLFTLLAMHFSKAQEDCQENQYKCESGSCIPSHWVCDDDPDCPDRSDESSCSKTSKVITNCPEHKFQCDNGVCINTAFVCDGDEDCLDKSDETCEFKRFRRICYFTNWAQYRKGAAKFLPENINPEMCTHIIYAFARLEGTKLVFTEYNDHSMYKRFNSLKNKTRGLKTMLAIGGWNAGSKAFSEMVETPERRLEFVLSAIQFLRQHNFDGLDIDWEYPTLRQGKPEDKERFALLIKETREAFDIEARKSLFGRLLLSAAVPTGQKVVDSGYDIPTISKHVDFLNLMSYDFHGGWERKTGHNSPLYSSSEEPYDTNMNIEKAAKYWVSKGTPKGKLNIGIATYGRSFILADPTDSYGIGAPVSGPGPQGKYTQELGFYSYYEICQLQDDGNGQVYRDEDRMVPYYVKGDLWIGYDDEESVQNKAEWVAKAEYGGSMVWSLSLDDFGKTCSSTTVSFPLTRAISSTLLKVETSRLPNHTSLTTKYSAIPTTTIETSTNEAILTKSRSESTTVSPLPQITTKLWTADLKFDTIQNKPPPPIWQSSDLVYGPYLFSCRQRPFGYFPDPNNCNKYFVCNMGRTFHYRCPSDLRFNPRKITCDWANSVSCDDDGRPMY